MCELNVCMTECMYYKNATVVDIQRKVWNAIPPIQIALYRPDPIQTPNRITRKIFIHFVCWVMKEILHFFRFFRRRTKRPR